MAGKTQPKFVLTDLLNKRSKEAAELEMGNRTEDEDMEGDGIIRTADIYDLIPSKDNFYSVDDVRDLKQSIELVGVLQPILVNDKDENGKYEIIAGHRRRIAVVQLVEEGKERFRNVPIMVKPKKDAILDKLTLIMANRFREKTDWEKMTEALETEDLVTELKETVNIPGRTRDLLAEILETSPSQVGRYKAIYNNLIPELMEEFKAGNIVVSVIYEASGLPEEYQQQAAGLFRENGVLTLPDIKRLKADYEAAQQIPGQMDINQLQQEEQPEANAHENENHAGSREEQETEEEQWEDPEYIDPQPESMTSLCYSCTHYEECHDKKATVTRCNAYKNRREAYKTDEQRYNEEQAAIDRETKRKLQEMQQEEKMQHLPSDEPEKQRDIRITGSQYEEITTGILTFLLLKKDRFKIGEELELQEYTAGQQTGRKVSIEIIYVMEDRAGIDDEYCIVGFNVDAFDV